MRSATPCTRGRLAGLSVQALQHAQRLERVPVEAIAARLYAWNRLPSSTWRRVSAEPAFIAQAAAAAAESRWEQVAPGPPHTPWCVWRLRDGPSVPIGKCWKLYVSPQPECLAQAVGAAIVACTGLPVFSLKYGLDAAGMLRPDKLVVHVADANAVRVLGDRLLRSLAGCPAQGVPFTCEIAGDGLLSWGVDPPPTSLAARSAPSWRLWVTQTLARGLHNGGARGVEPWQVALRELQNAGVDPETWAPSRELWSTDTVRTPA